MLVYMRGLITFIHHDVFHLKCMICTISCILVKDLGATDLLREYIFLRVLNLLLIFKLNTISISVCIRLDMICCIDAPMIQETEVYLLGLSFTGV